jgi:hypothetical protein
LADSSLEYLPTAKLAEFTTPNGGVKIATQHVVSVSNLVLTSDVSAQGVVELHRDINDLERFFERDGELPQPLAGDTEGNATFAKQPDGSWICTGI